MDGWKKTPTLDVYFAPLGSGPVEEVYPPTRQARIAASANENQRRQRYFAWKLLEYALENSFGLALSRQEFSLDEKGKWHCAACFFSLSHSRDGVAVAVSRQPVGVDLECLDRPFAPGLAQKILTEKERAEYAALAAEARQGYLLEKWCAKESLYKAGGISFYPRQMDADARTATGRVTLADREYAYAVTGRGKLRIFSAINL